MRVFEAVRWAFIACSIILSCTQANIVSAQIPIDFMIQEVCDDGNGGHTAADPQTCPGLNRKLRIGETLPYHKWDGTPYTPSYQISDSYPIADIYGRTRVVQNFFATNFSVVPYADMGNSSSQAAYDMLNDDGNFVAYSGTYDASRGWQPFFTSSACTTSDAWIITPKSNSIPFASGNQTSTLNIQSPQCPTNSSFGQSLAVWDYYSGFLYRSGASLPTIKLFHFSNSTVNSDAIEMFFYTKEYGKTRWEQWVSVNPDMQKNAAAAAKCVNGTSGGVVQFGYTTYYIQDCRDWSFTAPAQEGEWDPASFHIDPFHNSNNLLTNTHMQCTNAGAASDCGFGGTCQTIAPWQRIGNLNWGFDQSLMGTGRSANCALLISIPSPPAGQGVYQDVSNVQNPGAVYSFGASIWARNLAPGQTGSAEIVVFELNSSGGIVARNSVFATVGDTPRFTTGTFVMASATRRLRFQIYPQNQDMNYEISDSWAALQP